MKPAIDQMITWLDGEMAKYPLTGQSMLDKGYRVLGQSRVQAIKIKDRCDVYGNTSLRDAANKRGNIGGVWTIDFVDSCGNHYEIKTRTYRITRTQHDPEIEQRKQLAESDRDHKL